MKKTLLILSLLALALAACSKREQPGILMPSYACTQTPTGESKTTLENESCGRGCSRDVPYTYYAVKVSCEHTEWRLK